MLNHEGSHHEHFEELCALAASGQILEPEFVELQDHMQRCASCRSAYEEFVDLLHGKLPLANPDIADASTPPGFFSENSSYRERFLARARREGVAVSSQRSRELSWSKLRRWVWPAFANAPLASAALAVLLITVALLGYGLYQSNLRYTRVASDRAELATQLSRARGSANSPPEESTQPTEPPRDSVPAAIPNSLPDRKTEAELADVRSERAAAEERAKLLEDQLMKVSSELTALRTQAEQTTVSREQLETQLKEAERLANAVKEDLQEIRQARSKDSLTMAAQDLEIQKLSERLSEQADMLEQERALLEASRDVRDLMGARNFHIADVYDVDSKGKDQRAFGRVFYTERKSTLIFYAFDLNDRNTARRNASFQVWGKRGPAQGPTHSLGLFQIDDQQQNRWVLRFEDPQVLAQIDSVFVTVEPAGGSAKPTGRQFLYAYLNANPSR